MWKIKIANQGAGGNRIRTFGIYALCVILFFVFSNIMIDIALKSSYNKINTYKTLPNGITMDITESKATYDEIIKYVWEKFGMKVPQLYIAQVKREFGLIERSNYNIGNGKAKVPKVTPEKREAIIDALKHFQMI